MKPVEKRRLKANLLRPLRRARALIAWRRWSFRGVPVVFGNAMPKSGSKMLLQILRGLSQVGPFVPVESGPLRTITIDGRTRSQVEIAADLQRLQPGDVTLGYLRCTPENAAFLRRPDWASFFLLRDPRDMLVSHVFYATDMYAGHGMHETYARLPGMAERLAVAIRGLQEGSRLPDVGERYRRMEGWLACPEVLALHFEDFILDRQSALEAMLAHLERAGLRLTLPRQEAIGRLAKAIDPERSPTFRRGQVGGWREHFSAEHKRLFKETAGDLLIRLGYEKDHDW
jgi:hypothetical protein